MKYFPTLCGNEFIKKNLAAEIFGKTNSHAYILEGDDGSGKHTVAKLSAAALFCTDTENGTVPCGKCSFCKKVLSDLSVDVITICKGDKQTIGVDVIREKVKDGLSLSPVESPMKVYIIEESDKMTPAAQNSLLLSLEEPPKFVVFFLLCNDSSKLLETVKSRCILYRMEKFTPKKIEDYLTSCGTYSKFLNNRANLDFALAASNGSIGKAIYMIENDDAEGRRLRDVCKKTVKALCGKRTYAKMKAVEEFPNDRNTSVNMLRQIKAALRDLIAVKKQKEPNLLFYTDTEEAVEVSSKVSVAKLVKLFDATAKAECALTDYANIQSVLTLFASEIQ